MPKTSAKKVKYDGITFDSQAEWGRYVELKALQKQGKIIGLEVHKQFVLIDKSQFGRAIKYISDFTYFLADKKRTLVVEDVKSKYTAKFPVYRLKRRLFAERYGFEITETIR